MTPLVSLCQKYMASLTKPFTFYYLKIKIGVYMKFILTVFLLISLNSAFAQRDHRRNPQRHRPQRVNPPVFFPPQAYTPFQHRPHNFRRQFAPVWNTNQYFNHFQVNFGAFLFQNTWLMRTYNHANGFVWLNNYPYFIHNGVINRYHPVDQCRFDLVDKALINSNTDPVHSFYYGSCNFSYNQCASVRHGLNYRFGAYRFFCAERRY